ncbi:MAG: hypothetical protein OXG83_09070 [Acidobacteria bacterium]|nr:hypothetical protein [Acidobacteriota bacterium]
MNEPRRPSRFLPRTRDGWIATIAFGAVFLLAMPPVTHTLLNRVEPSVLGVPFLYLALFGVYVALIAVLIWAYRRGV